jgi:uroporphyrinogen decarboxylase
MEKESQGMTPWERFAKVARGEQADRVPVALIVDSPWLPGFAGIDTLDYFLQPDQWLRINLDLLKRFPDVTWIPGFWVEYGMAAEPSAFGTRIVWHHDQPPSIEPVRDGLATLVEMEPPDPNRHGLMPLILQLYTDVERRLLAKDINIKMVAARGPLAIASWLLGVTEILIALTQEPGLCSRLIDMLTETVISWLRAQLSVLRAPEGILLLDDIVGMLSPKMFEQFVRPYYTRIFGAFNDLIKVYHNDTPCLHLLEPMSALGFDVFNFSHELDIVTVQAKMPGIVLMGNVPPLSIMARGTPEEAESWARECVRKTGGHQLILSAGGGASPGTLPETVDALSRVAMATEMRT